MQEQYLQRTSVRLAAHFIKRTSVRLATLCTLVLVCVTGCGGSSDNAAAPVTSAPVSVVDGTGGSATAPSPSAPTNLIKVSGKVMNVGYLRNTQVCADLNADGLCSEGEPSTITDNNGSYTLSVATGNRGVSLMAIVRPESIDSAATVASPIAFKQGWVLSNLFEYEDDAQTVSLNISPLTTAYYSRMRLSGRNRLSNSIAVFTRIVSEPNIDPVTQKPILAVDFDYVANPKNTLAARLKTMTDVLSTKANTLAKPLDMLTTTAMHSAWYSTYVASSATVRSLPSDATKIAAYLDANTNSPAYYVAQDYRYFRPNSTSAALRLRDGLTETAGWLRKKNQGVLETVDRRATTLSNGSIIYKLARLQEGEWSSITVEEPEYFTLTRAGKVAVHGATDDLQPRAITAIDGNALTFKLLNSDARFTFEISDSPGTDFFIEEWVGEQNSYATYYNGTAPLLAPVAVKPTCVMDYPGTPQPNSAANLASTSITTWFSVCYNYYTAEYFDLVKKDVTLTLVDPKLPGANFYDSTLKDSLLVAPVKTACGSEAIPLKKVTLAGKEQCNWAVDANTGHVVKDLFANEGIAINSWTKTYGTNTFTTGTGAMAVTTTLMAGSEAQLGLPQQLNLKLVRTGTETSGTGTFTSPYGAWTATSNKAVTETIQWEIAADNPNMVLISWPFRDSGDPRVLSTQAADGSVAVTAPVLPAGHFTATWNGNAFSAAPSTRTAPNYRKLAIVLVDGAFVTGQYYGKGYTYNERYFTIPAMGQGIDAMNYIFNRLYQTGFVDK